MVYICELYITKFNCNTISKLISIDYRQISPSRMRLCERIKKRVIGSLTHNLAFSA